MEIEEIYKRNHLKKPFLVEKITEAILKAMLSAGEGGNDESVDISKQVYSSLLLRKEKIPYYIPNVEEIQDLVEQTLMQSKYFKAAKAYILYRNEQTKKRQRNIFERRIECTQRGSSV